MEVELSESVQWETLMEAALTYIINLYSTILEANIC